MLDFIFPRRCAFCRRPCADGLCGDCRDKLPWRENHGTVIAPLYYRDAARRVLLRYKFGGASGCAAVFGMLAARAVRTANVDADALTWVPCSFRRRWTRGYDQSEKLARAIGKELELPVYRTIVKKRHTKSQTKMPDDEARRKNVRDAFRLRPDAKVRGLRLLLVDDICTTGATLDECRRALLGGGAEEVFFCTAAARKGVDKQQTL